MPIYEYNCWDCHTHVDIFFRSFADIETKKVICPQCKGANLERIVSKVTVVQSGQGQVQTQAGASNPLGAEVDKSDPKALARSMREASQKSGQEFGSEFKEVTRRLERGENAASVETSLRKRAGEKMQAH